MATADETNTTALPSFSTIKGHERRAVILKAEGKTIDQITAHINNEFALDYSAATVKEWFFAGGRLEQAYSEYNEAMAEQSLKEGRQLIKKATRSAAAVLIRQLGPSFDPNIQQSAAKALLNKFVPDKQVSLTGEHVEPTVPDEIAAIADQLAEEDSDGSEQVDDPPQGGEDPATPGA